jgi:hypothetical protein
MATILYYVDLEGGSPFEVWFSGLDQGPAAKVTVGIKRLSEAMSQRSRRSVRVLLKSRLIGGRDSACISGVTAWIS